MKRRQFLGLGVAAMGAACRTGPPKFDDVVGEYVYVTLSFQPTLATEAGYQRHAGVALGELLDDVSQSSLDRQRQFYQAFEKGFGRFQRDRLSPQDQIDYDLIASRIPRDVAALDDFHHSPARYVAILERALRVPIEKEYAPKDLRAFHLTRRLEMMVPFLDHARRNLQEARGPLPDLAGVRGWIDRAAVEVTGEIRPKFDIAQAKARKALDAFDAFLPTLPRREEAASSAPLLTAPEAPPGSSLARRVLRAGLTAPVEP